MPIDFPDGKKFCELVKNDLFFLFHEGKTFSVSGRCVGSVFIVFGNIEFLNAEIVNWLSMMIMSE